jgi:hypothetical protein
LRLQFIADADLAAVELGAPIRIRPPQPTIKPASELVFLCLKFIADADLAVVELGAPASNPAPATNN